MLPFFSPKFSTVNNLLLPNITECVSSIKEDNTDKHKLM